MNILLPSFKITGGNLEALKLAIEINENFREFKKDIKIWALWNCELGIDIKNYNVGFISNFFINKKKAILHYPILLVNFFKIQKEGRKKNSDYWIFTHYSTYPFSYLVNKNKRFYFIQDLEWIFISNKLMQKIMKKIILNFISSGKIIVANDYLEVAITNLGFPVYGNIKIWADEKYRNNDVLKKDIDCAMVLRTGQYKRLDLYIDFIMLCSSIPNFRVAVISPDINIYRQFLNISDVCLFSPTLEEMKGLYARSKFFIHLSDHEGFGLPPLEAMGSGCIPFCRDSGGVMAYMKDLIQYGLLVPQAIDINEVYLVFKNIFNDKFNHNDLMLKTIKIFNSGFEREGLQALLNNLNHEVNNVQNY